MAKDALAQFAVNEARCVVAPDGDLVLEDVRENVCKGGGASLTLDDVEIAKIVTTITNSGTLATQAMRDDWAAGLLLVDESAGNDKRGWTALWPSASFDEFATRLSPTCAFRNPFSRCVTSGRFRPVAVEFRSATLHRSSWSRAVHQEYAEPIRTAS